MKNNQFQLLREQRFLPFFLTQFLGAFNDNVFKNALVILVAFHLSTRIDTSVLINLAAGLFILPFFLFSATAGQMADKYEKSGFMRRIKVLEICIMLLGAVGFILGSVELLLTVLFLMGTQSTFFGPAKYGILPQHVRERELVGANGLVETGTFLAILLGTLLGGIMIDLGQPGRWIVSAAVVTFAILGWLTSRKIPYAAPVDPTLKVSWNLFTQTIHIVRYVTADRTVLHAVLGISWFWLFGAVLLTQLPNYTKLVLHGDGTVATLLLTMFSLGIGIGSLLCERLAHRRVEMGLVPLGSIGLTVFGLDLAFAHPDLNTQMLASAGGFLADSGNWHVLIDLLLISMFGGFYIVPLYALIQARADARYRSRIIAGNNILNSLFMVIAALLGVGLLRAGLSIPQLFLTLALMNAAVAIYIYTLVPEFLVRLLVWLLINTLYRVTEEDVSHIPEKGPAVLVCNHVSFVDALIILAVSHRPVRFVMDHTIFKTPVLNFIFRNARAIPVASGRQNRELLIKAYDEIAAALDNGEVICIFPEGKITYDGKLGKFRNGIEKIIQRTPVPVVPLALNGLWGSFFSRKGGAAMRRLPRHFWAKIGIVSGAKVAPQDVSAELLHDRVAALIHTP